MRETFEGNSDNLRQGPDSSGHSIIIDYLVTLKLHTHTQIELVLILGLIFLRRDPPS
jgi:hypothetical protein